MSWKSLEQVLEELDLEIISLENISPTVFLLKTHEKTYILKFYGESGIRRLINYIRRDKFVCFKNEIEVNRQLLQSDKRLFLFPEMLKTDGKNYILFEHIEDYMISRKDELKEKDVISSLIAFQTSDIRVQHNFYYRYRIFIKRNIPMKILRWSHKVVDGPTHLLLLIKCYLFLLKALIVSKKTNVSLQTHNDLFRYNNMILNKDNQLVLCDFEFVKSDQKWFLIDIIDLCFDLQTFEFDQTLFDKYITELSEIVELNASGYKIQIKVILLRKILGRLTRRDLTLEQRKILVEFIEEILMNRKAYDQWYAVNI
ncbi:MAG: hypothetical protein JEZ08_17510 [Clostridiales bacterium]|nr:hypothetical protein [Clostridiales bacterium]